MPPPFQLAQPPYCYRCFFHDPCPRRRLPFRCWLWSICSAELNVLRLEGCGAVSEVPETGHPAPRLDHIRAAEVHSWRSTTQNSSDGTWRRLRGRWNITRPCRSELRTDYSHDLESCLGLRGRRGEAEMNCTRPFGCSTMQSAAGHSVIHARPLRCRIVCQA